MILNFYVHGVLVLLYFIWTLTKKIDYTAPKIHHISDTDSISISR
jgi:hypothetical protein